MTAPGETCRVDGCPAAVCSRGWCRRHYTRWWRYGDPEHRRALMPRRVRPPRPSVVERLEAGIDKSGGPAACWPWRGAKTEGGYARVGKHYAYRLVWEAEHGPVPDGLYLVRVASCKTEACCNPAHWRPATAEDRAHMRKLRGRDGRGIRHLHEADAVTITQRRERGVPRHIVARQFGVHPNHVTNITQGHCWAGATG